MNTITEPRHSISSPTESDFQGGKGPQPKPGLGELWLAILALVAVVGLAVAVATGAVGNSSQTDAVTVVDPRADADFHREVPTPKQGMDSDVYREQNQQASKAAAASVAALDPRADADFHREAPAASSGMDSDVHRELNQQASQADATPHYENGGLTSDEFWEVYGSDTPDPRDDADHHREANA
jgi:hypothetical protein